MAADQTYVFHITPLENLRRIFAAGELRAKRALDQDAAGYTTIAHQTIQDRRATTVVPCAPYGVLHDYVPFYFGARSPMLYAISRGNVKGFDGSQRSIAHMVATAQDIRAQGLDFAFTDGHGIIALTEFYNDLANLSEVDQALMTARYWADTDEDPDRKRRRQAEFLVHQRLPLELVRGIGVVGPSQKAEVEALLAEFGWDIPVAMMPRWYY